MEEYHRPAISNHRLHPVATSLAVAESFAVFERANGFPPEGHSEVLQEEEHLQPEPIAHLEWSACSFRVVAAKVT